MRLIVARSVALFAFAFISKSFLARARSARAHFVGVHVVRRWPAQRDRRRV
jgi:hypothetical protein